MLKIAKSLLISLLAVGIAFADELTLRDDAPTQYVVKKGDTLWDISAMFLNSPWKWPELWGHNPQIDNPHLIYPGDILRLVYTADGQPRLVVANTSNVIKVSPTKRTTIKRYQPVETLPLSTITPYLSYERILLGPEYDDAPMVLGGDTHTKRKIEGDTIYAGGNLSPDEMYGIYTKSRQFGETNAETGEVAFYELELAGTARVMRLDEDRVSHKMKILNSRQTIKQGYRLLPLLSDKSLPANYTLTPPAEVISANIIGTSSKSREFSKLEVVIIDAGSEQGLATGNVMGVYSRSPQVVMQEGLPVYVEDASAFTKFVDQFEENKQILDLPTELVGQIVVFKVYDKVSYALVTEAEKVLRVDDYVGMPQ
ncbi:LysM peptidoglycan-binding domain-containing protein [Catenovulum sp. SM1970]|uniref:LysM peptidoglycan-binding domain-containing protein n=1 Tax=Marinifaba aquimaris TaxID=2741323 RepID=UPI0015726089|nr:LysM domain-containing protein [Marinifaba aquimaris]NTS78653.1 LysM peptidoglycan-binding domain-containing protein [Marinifaba aquimaris]